MLNNLIEDIEMYEDMHMSYREALIESLKEYSSNNFWNELDLQCVCHKINKILDI